MGTWAEGNFDNDGALDFVGEVMDGIITRIKACFANRDDASLDEEGEAVIMPSMEILSVLAERCGAAPPKTALVADWKKRYLAIFDEEIDGLQPVGDHGQKRRAVIEATFDKLEAQARTFWIEE